ncbi:MAG: hypothetical protein ACPGUE_20440, partial [Marinomonas sp.]
ATPCQWMRIIYISDFMASTFSNIYQLISKVMNSLAGVSDLASFYTKKASFASIYSQNSLF